MPPWQDYVWYDLYRSADIDNRPLDLDQAVNLAKHGLEATLTTLLRSPAVAKAFGDNPKLIADRWARTHGAVPLGRAVITYKTGVTVDVLDVASMLQSCITINTPHLSRMARIIESNEHIKTSARIFFHSDRDVNGRLTWNEGEIREFIGAVFQHYGLHPPLEDQMYGIFSKFDLDRSGSLDAMECAELVDALLRSLFTAASRDRGYTQPPSGVKDLRKQVQAVQHHPQQHQPLRVRRSASLDNTGGTSTKTLRGFAMRPKTYVQTSSALRVQSPPAAPAFSAQVAMPREHASSGPTLPLVSI